MHDCPCNAVCVSCLYASTPYYMYIQYSTNTLVDNIPRLALHISVHTTCLFCFTKGGDIAFSVSQLATLRVAWYMSVFILLSLVLRVNLKAKDIKVTMARVANPASVFLSYHVSALPVARKHTCYWLNDWCRKEQVLLARPTFQKKGRVWWTVYTSHISPECN